MAECLKKKYWRLAKYLKTSTEMNSREILRQENELIFNHFRDEFLINLGMFGLNFCKNKNLPVALEIQTQGWTVFHGSLPGTSPENDSWISRKARVVEMKHHSTLFERVNAEERGVDWYRENKVSEKNFAIHGGGFPLTSEKNGYIGCIIISGLPQVEDHLLCVEVLSKFIDSQKTEND